MNRLHSVLYSLLFCLSFPLISGQETYTYKKELKALKKNPEYQVLFDRDANPGLRTVAQDIENYSELSFFSRLIRSIFFMLGGVVVTPKTMPQLYGYIDSLCKKQGIATPTIFITTYNGLFNAAAAKLFVSTGGIIIGQRLIKEIPDHELEAIMAHEIGHIYHNHRNKIMLTKLICYLLVSEVYDHYVQTDTIPKVIARYYTVDLIESILERLIIQKRFERQADAFACDVADRAQGLVDFYTRLIAKEAQKDYDFQAVYVTLQNNKKIGFLDSLQLYIRYYIHYGSHQYDKVWRWIYHNTPYGPHPSHQDRIEAAQQYLAAQAGNRIEY